MKDIPFKDPNVMSFGKYKGQPFTRVPPNYLLTMYRLGVNEKVKTASKNRSLMSYVAVHYDRLMKEKTFLERLENE